MEKSTGLPVQGIETLKTALRDYGGRVSCSRLMPLPGVEPETSSQGNQIAFVRRLVERRMLTNRSIVAIP